MLFLQVELFFQVSADDLKSVLVEQVHKKFLMTCL